MNESFNKILTQKEENSSYCLAANNPNLFINNSYATQYSQYIDISFQICSNETMNNTCQPLDKIVDILERLVFYVIVTDISIDNREINPVQKVVSYKPYLVSGTFSRKIYINYKKIIFCSSREQGSGMV